MPMNKENYPDDWPEISFRIRWDRAKNRCECTGECGRDHGLEWIDDDIEDYWAECIAADGGLDPDDKTRCAALNHYHHPVTDSMVVLTVAHWPDSDTMNCEVENLLALCQRCHNKLDAPMRARHAAETRRKKMRDAGQLNLL